MNSLHTISRRSLLLGGVAVSGLATVGALGIMSGPAKAVHAVPAQTPLKVPTQHRGRMIDGVRVYDLAMQSGKTEFFSGVRTPTLGINGSYLGPVLRMRAGEDVRINVTNGLQEPTTLHWHGFNLPASADGGPHQIINPGAVWSPEFTLREKASTMWYHSHLMHKTAEQVWAGLAGMVLIDDHESDTLQLPAKYGVDDIPIVLQDRIFNQKGDMPYNPGMHFKMMGMTGDVPMVNGTVGAFFDVTTEMVRLRILNGSNGSIYNLGFSDNRRFQQIAGDGGLLAAPVTLSGLRLAPGERAEIVVSMFPGSTTTLQSRALADNGGMGMTGGGGGPEFDFLELRSADNLKPSASVPSTLAALPEIDSGQAVKTRKFVLQMPSMGPGIMLAMARGRAFKINGKSMDIDVINEVVKRGETEIWEISNTSMMAHPFHVHNTQFRILYRNGRPPHAGEAGRKDTVLVNAGETVRIVIRFDHYADPKVPYMYHCHILEHEDGGMMGQFTVV